MLHCITAINEVKPYKIICVFDHAETREIDFEKLINKYKITSPNLLGKLADISYFKSVTLDSYGTLNWQNEIDFCPDTLYKDSVKIAS
jgi:hypothetical protein